MKMYTLMSQPVHNTISHNNDDEEANSNGAV
jgi:hypothetical protein